MADLRRRAAIAFTLLACVAFFAVGAHAQEPVSSDPHLTPGAANPDVTQSNIYETICVRGWARTVRPPEEYTYRLKREQQRYRDYADQNPRDYEEDHLIPLELGGSPTSPRNLWPEPWYGAWNAHIKDHLENYLHEQVCEGRMPLAEAQWEIAVDWIAAYQKYLGEPR